MVRNKAAIAKYLSIQPSEIDRMYYWEYEYLMEDMNEMMEKEKEQSEDNGEGSMSQQASNTMRDIKKQSSSMLPSMNNFKTPQMPKIPKMPKI